MDKIKALAVPEPEKLASAAVDFSAMLVTMFIVFHNLWTR